MCKNYLEIGKVVGTHGIKGELRVSPWCDSPSFLCAFSYLYICKGKQNYRQIQVEDSRNHKNIVLLKVSGVETLEQAEALRGEVLYMSRDDIELEEGRYFIQDIIGCDVTDAASGEHYGKITDVISTEANDVYQIESASGKINLIPVIEGVVMEINPGKKLVTINPIKGLLNDEN